MPEVIVAGFGSGDLHVSAGYPLREPDGSLNRALEYPKSKAALAKTKPKSIKKLSLKQALPLTLSSFC